MTKHAPAAVAAIILAAIAAPAALPAGPAATQPSSGKTQTLRIFDRNVASTLTQRSGKVTRRPPYPEPKPGDILDVYSLGYLGNHLNHAKRWSLSTHLRCTFGKGQPDCTSHVAVGGSLLIFHGNKLESGTGIYQGATGRVLSSKEIPGTANGSDIVARINRH